MKRPLGRTNRSYIPALTALGFSVLFFVYDFYYVASQKSYLDERNFRALAAVSNQLEQEVTHFRAVMAAALALKVSEVQNNTAYRACVDAKKPEEICARELYLSKYLNGFIPGTIFMAGNNDVPNRKGTVRLRQVSESNELAIEIEYREAQWLSGESDVNAAPEKPVSAEKKVQAAQPFCQANGNDLVICAVFKADQELRRLFLSAGEQLFDDILVADASGSVLFQQGLSGTRVKNLNTLLLNTLPQAPAPDNSTKPDSAAPKQPAAAKNQIASFDASTQASTVLDGKLAGRMYRLYIEPAPVALSAAERVGADDIKLLVCGLWRADRFRTEAASIPYSRLISWALWFLLSFCLAWPLLKVTYVSPRERLRVTNVLFLLGSVVCAAALLMLIVLDRSYQAQAQRETAGNLTELAHGIQRNVTQEIRRAHEFTHSGDVLKFVKKNNTGTIWAKPNFIQDYSNVQAPAGGGKAPYLYFDNMFWADQQGQQTFKTTVEEFPTPKVSVKEEDYFRAVLESRLSTLPDGTSFSLQPLFSPNTGEFFVVISSPFQPACSEGEPCGNEFAASKAAVMVSRFISLVDPVMPPGYGYAVVNQEGKVQFHSHSARNLVEDFVKESQNDASLRAILSIGSSAPLDINYLGRRQQVLIRPLPNSWKPAWSLIVFRDSDYFNTLYIACILGVALLLGAYTLPFVLIGVAYFKLKRPKYPLAFIWPRSEEWPNYLNIITANFCLAATFSATYRSVPGNLLPAFIMLTALVAFGFTLLKEKGTSSREEAPPATARPVSERLLFLGHVCVLLLMMVMVGSALRASPNVVWALIFPALYAVLVFAGRFRADIRGVFPRDPWGRGLRLWYVSSLLSILIVMVGLPCVGFFYMAYGSVHRLALERQQLTLRQDIRDRGDAIGKRYQRLRDTDGSGSNWGVVGAERLNTVKEQRLKEKLDRYDLAFFNKPGLNARSPCYGEVPWLERAIAKASEWFPTNPVGTELRELALAQFSTNDVQWSSAACDRGVCLTLRPSETSTKKLAGAPLSQDMLPITSSYPEWRAFSGAKCILVILSCLFIPWLYVLVRQVFLLKFIALPALPAVKEIGLPHRNTIIIGHPRSGKSRVAISSSVKVDRLDFQEIGVADKWTSQGFNTADRRPIVLHHFEFRLGDDKICAAKLELLEHLVFVEKRLVILLSAVDPMFYLAESVPASADDPAAPSPSQMLDRWAAVLSLFHKVQADDKNEDELTPQSISPLHPDERVYELVSRECGHTPQLRRIGKDMLLEHRDATLLTDRQLMADLSDKADPYYRVLWATCSRDERVTLFQLAQDGWANPKNKLAIQQLARRNIVVQDVGFRIMNETFRLFVRNSPDPIELREWNEESRRSAWKAIKLGLVTAAVLLVVWLLYAQQSLFQVSVGYIAALGTAAGVILNVISNLRGRKAEAAGDKPG